MSDIKGAEGRKLFAFIRNSDQSPYFPTVEGAYETMP
jgi:hypothetical protein